MDIDVPVPDSFCTAVLHCRREGLSYVSYGEIVKLNFTIPSDLDLPISFPMCSFRPISLFSRLRVLHSVEKSVLRQEEEPRW